MIAYGGGLELGEALPLGPITVGAGGVVGIRAFTMPLVAFETHTCTRAGRGGSSIAQCQETASTKALPYVQPRLRLDVALNAKRTLFAGGFVGADMLGDWTVLGGIAIALRLPIGP